MKPKPFFQSKTIVGAVMMLIAIGLQITQVEVTQGELDEAAGHLDQAIQAVTALVGFVMVIWGRIKATRPIAIPGK